MINRIYTKKQTNESKSYKKEYIQIPTLREVLKSSNRFLENVFLKKNGNVVVANIESNTKVLSKEDADKLYSMIRSNEKKILDYFGGGDYIEINIYINESKKLRTEAKSEEVYNYKGHKIEIFSEPLIWNGKQTGINYSVKIDNKKMSLGMKNKESLKKNIELYIDQELKNESKTYKKEITDTEVNKLSKETGKSAGKIKELYKKAEEQAKKQGKEKDYAYIHGILYKMIGK